MSGRGKVYGVGVGPGDPELVTVKAVRALESADVVAYYSGTRKRSIARSIAAPYLRDGVVEELLAYPVTTGTTDHPRGYFGAMEDFYDESAARIAAHLDAGRTVAILAEGDPLFYSSFMYLHDRLAPSYDVEIIPGITSISGSSAVAAQAISRHEDVLTVLPGTLPKHELARRLADTEAAVIMKLGKHYPAVIEALREAGRLDEAIYVERATHESQRVAPAASVDPSTVPYFSQIIVPGIDRRADSAGRASSPGPVDVPRPGGHVWVVGLGPGPERWLTPEASDVLARVDHVVGYAPYVARVPQRTGLARHASGNTVEVDRARLALDLAAHGEQVAVVSGGDVGVFGMASAVFEAAADPAYADVPVTVLPAVTAASAVAALAGAPLGADFAMVSLSDRLKPWEVVEQRLRALGAAGLVIAIYNPRSSARPDQLHRAREALLEVRDGGVPVIIGRDVGRPEEQLTVTTLAELDPEQVDMKCLVIVGSDATSTTPSGRVWSARFVR